MKYVLLLLAVRGSNTVVSVLKIVREKLQYETATCFSS